MSVYESRIQGLNEAIEYNKDSFPQIINRKIVIAEKQIENGEVIDAESALEELRNKYKTKNM